ncbi:MAG TPA: hypothetical protein PKU94_05450 [Candidatus Hydrothermia bacterium]|nr:hypothetical protein [Candidatus Hydrothermae bacterium]MDD3649589.1 hypothetical protein [Candidatus Hydrothermia bacterium]MDD5572755.1 hypothetical protein [Candidatus Hydrothermia bacterium]HOK23501.1 hypothetical protein [Candidatus Hydrothermia bacterium]HOL24043.1 hypothetical protein [Candidatus Hydrothermia bacterium]
MTSIIWTWIAAFFTLAILSFLYKDNPLYKFAEHVYVGSSAAFTILYVWVFDAYPKLVMGFREKVGMQKYLLIIPLILSLFIILRFIKPLSWLSRWSIAFTVGMAAGLGITGLTQGFLVPQVQASFLPLFVQGPTTGQTILLTFNNIIIVFGTIFTILYFYFSREHKGLLGVSSKIGVTILMITFGASFGYTIMARISLLIQRVYFLLHNWLGLV